MLRWSVDHESLTG